MKILNFTHPLSQEALEEIRYSIGEDLEVQPIAVDLDLQSPLVPQVEAILAQCELSSDQWQTESILINPPGMANCATILVAAIHGRMGHFPAILRMVQRDDRKFHLAEIIDLQDVRNEARTRRF